MKLGTIVAVAIAALLAGACAPRLAPLTGAEAPATRLPRTEMPTGHRRLA
jgi:hypothetical protein